MVCPNCFSITGDVIALIQNTAAVSCFLKIGTCEKVWTKYSDISLKNKAVHGRGFSQPPGRQKKNFNRVATG